jgi:formylglycine-generating enzyme required for sulfatase activity
MKKLRQAMFAFLMLTLLLSACGSQPTPVVMVVTATPMPPTETAAPEPTPTLVPVPLSGAQDGTTMRWIDGSTLAYVPQSEFVMGNAGFDAPVRTVALDAFWIYETKVTNRMYAQCVAVGACTNPTEELGGPVYSNPQYVNHPVIGVSWDQAQSYCVWAQGQLPTEAQWEKAARGTSGGVYPWGDEKPACDLLNLGYCSGRTTEVDAFSDGVSPYGLYDMAGNVFEWVSDWYDEAYYASAPAANPTGPESGKYRVIRGSSFETDFDQVESAMRHFGTQTYHSRDLGFRCTVTAPQPLAPYCQTAAYIPTGVIVANGCELPQTGVAGQYCAGGNSFATVDIPDDAVYEVSKALKCEEAVVDGQRLLTCLGPKAKETTNEITVCNPTCSNSPNITGAVPTCDPGYALDSANGVCNYSPVSAQVGVAGCPVGYVISERGGVQSCVVGINGNGECPTGLYFDNLAGRCVPPSGAADAPYGIDNAPLALASYAGCPAGYSFSDVFQCCQAVSGGTYPGCPPGATFNSELGACSPSEIRLAGPGCVTLDVTTLRCSQPVDTCSPISNETRCINNPFCRWNENAGTCDIRK